MLNFNKIKQKKDIFFRKDPFADERFYIVD